MTEIVDDLQVAAPVSAVWEAIADPARHAHWHPFVTAITGRHDEGATRSCEVIVGRKRGRTEERCLQRDEQQQIAWRIDSDTTGFSKMVSDWRAGFRLAGAPQAEATTVTAFSSFCARQAARAPSDAAHQAQVPPHPEGDPRRTQAPCRIPAPMTWPHGLPRRATR